MTKEILYYFENKIKEETYEESKNDSIFVLTLMTSACAIGGLFAKITK